MLFSADWTINVAASDAIVNMIGQAAAIYRIAPPVHDIAENLDALITLIAEGCLQKGSSDFPIGGPSSASRLCEPLSRHGACSSGSTNGEVRLSIRLALVRLRLAAANLIRQRDGDLQDLRSRVGGHARPGRA
jgi:hypothetical protein